MNLRSLPLAMLALGLLAPAPVAHADLVAPGYVETCTLAQQRREGEQCIECSASFQDAEQCQRQFREGGYTARCRTSGASVWQELGCRPVGAPAPEVSPPPIVPTPAVSPTPIAPTPAVSPPITPTPAPSEPTTNDPAAQPAPSPAPEAPGLCSARAGRSTSTAGLALLALVLALGLSRRRR